MGKIEELLKDKYKLRIPPTVYYDLLADVREVEEENDLEVSSGLEKNSKKLEKDFGELDCISRAQTQTEMEMYASRYTISKERGGMGQVEWSDQLIKVSDAVDIIRKLPSVTPQEPRWIPLTKRPMTDEEREHYFEYTDMRIDDTYTILDCLLPDDGQEVLVSWGGNVGIDVFIQDNEGCYFEDVDIDEVDAWMPLPTPFEPQESEDKE